MTQNTEERIELLVKKGTRDGVIYWEDIFDSVSEEEDAKSEISEIAKHIKQCGLKIADKEESAAPQKQKSDKNAELSDSQKIYLSEISRYPLLTREEERELAQKVASGDEKAKCRFILSNLRLVVPWARKYVSNAHSLNFQDLIQEGNIGLMKAVNRFDPTMDYRFSTYATWWIRQNITRAISDLGKSIRLPVHFYDAIRKYKKAESALESFHGREPTFNELIAYLNWSDKQLTFVMKNAQDVKSLDELIKDSDDTTVMDTVRDITALAPDVSAEQKALGEDMQNALACLSPREESVIRARYGFDDGTTKTLEEVGRMYGVTRERVRQIEAKALRKLHHPSRVKKLKPYMSFYYNK